MEEVSIKDLIDNIFKEWQIKKNPERAFVFAIRNFKRIPGLRNQGTFFEAYYALMRGIDNYVDGDVALPEEISVFQFVEERIAFLENLQTSPDFEAIHPYDKLLKYCIDVGHQFNQDFCKETMDIYQSLLFDAKRYGKLQKYDKETLNEHFFILDIRGTVLGMLKVYGESLDKYEFLKPLAIATRIYYNVRDIAEDLVAGYLNLPLEEIKQFGISGEDITNAIEQSKAYLDKLHGKKNEQQLKQYYHSLPSSLKNWIISESQKGLELLEQHKVFVKRAGFKLFTELTFPRVYEIPARNYFEKIFDYLGPPS